MPTHVAHDGVSHILPDRSAAASRARPGHTRAGVPLVARALATPTHECTMRGNHAFGSSCYIAFSTFSASCYTTFSCICISYRILLYYFQRQVYIFLTKYIHTMSYCTFFVETNIDCISFQQNKPYASTYLFSINT